MEPRKTPLVAAPWAADPAVVPSPPRAPLELDALTPIGGTRAVAPPPRPAGAPGGPAALPPGGGGGAAAPPPGPPAGGPSPGGAVPARLAGWLRSTVQAERRASAHPARRKGPFTTAMAEQELEAATST